MKTESFITESLGYLLALACAFPLAWVLAMFFCMPDAMGYCTNF